MEKWREWVSNDFCFLCCWDTPHVLCCVCELVAGVINQLHYFINSWCLRFNAIPLHSSCEGHGSGRGSCCLNGAISLLDDTRRHNTVVCRAAERLMKEEEITETGVVVIMPKEDSVSTGPETYLNLLSEGRRSILSKRVSSNLWLQEGVTWWRRGYRRSRYRYRLHSSVRLHLHQVQYIFICSSLCVFVRVHVECVSSSLQLT